MKALSIACGLYLLSLGGVAYAEPGEGLKREGRLLLSAGESFPLAGLGGALLSKHGAWHLGASLEAYLPTKSGDVRRYAAKGEAEAQYALYNTPLFTWHLGFGLGAAVFRDDYVAEALFSDETEVALGLSLATGIEMPIRPGLAGFGRLEFVGYKTSRISDDEWLQLSIGLSF